jgi:fibro-slime domain-containing protein
MAGDGCSATCTLEGSEFDCSIVTLSPPNQLDIPILYRDFLPAGVTKTGSDGGVLATGHPDFQIDPYNASTGLAETNLDAEGRPVFKSNKGNANSAVLLQSATSFYWWYHDKQCAADGGACAQNPYESLVYLDAMGKPTTLSFPKISGDAGVAVYQYTNNNFFPVDGLGWNANAATARVDNGHNFHFASELRYQFTYAGGEVLTFTGDDDVWVYINGKLAVDIGGIHGAQTKSITLDATAATNLGLTVGGMYEIALFQAERHTTASNYQLTLSGFVHQITQCVPHCGDGKVRGDETCDDGKNDGSYGSCLPGCKGRAGYCGDATLQASNEQCDDGNNSALYGGVSQQCGPGCKWAPYCGDGSTSNGEECDEGAMNGAGYGHCTAACKIGPRCGDAKVDAPTEQCDNGTTNGGSADPCSASCKLKCGDGVKDPSEQCDDGAANGPGYGKCSTTCTLGPRCGDGFKNGPEECDDGKNDGSYGTCNPDCKLANYCGDGKLTNPPETCDLGAQNDANAYGRNLCTNACKPGPYCGDKAVDGTFGEKCDDGVNSGQPGSCTADCKAWVPLQSCGDGIVQPPEACDYKANDGGASVTCDMNCRVKCGNGVKDSGEECDNGVNDGSYGTCKSNCTFAGYCGDRTLNGPEQCDNGKTNNVPLGSAYGKNICTAICSVAPFCGDGRVQTQFGEQCDGDANCNGSCKLVSVQ